jgi:hypothetical protein
MAWTVEDPFGFFQSLGHFSLRSKYRYLAVEPLPTHRFVAVFEDGLPPSSTFLLHLIHPWLRSLVQMYAFFFLVEPVSIKENSETLQTRREYKN